MPCATPLMVGTCRRHPPHVGQACWRSLLGAGMSGPDDGMSGEKRCRGGPERVVGPTQCSALPAWGDSSLRALATLPCPTSSWLGPCKMNVTWEKGSVSLLSPVLLWHAVGCQPSTAAATCACPELRQPPHCIRGDLSPITMCLPSTSPACRSDSGAQWG